MSGTFVQFSPSTTAVFAFQATLNGSQYNIATPYNVFRQDYYINVSDLTGVSLLYRALVGTGPSLPATFTWANGWATAACAAPHWVPIGNSVNMNVSNTGTEYDGNQAAVATSLTNLSYQIGNPEQTNIINGNVNFTWNLVSGYIPNAYLIFHWDTQQFEYG